jgi:predicted phosphate transport protein (TIGR00153 family)
MHSFFNKTRHLVLKIDTYIDLTFGGGLAFKEGLKKYMRGDIDGFEENLMYLTKMEHQADGIRKDIEAQLYVQTLIPESRGDVLGILESMDSIINFAKSAMLVLSIEKPKIPEKIKPQISELAEPVVKTIEELVSAVRAYFYDVNSVKNYLHKVKFYEKEADNLAEKIKREIFSMKIDLSHKNQLRYIITHIDTLADKAEDVSDRLAIAAIKRIV